MRRLRPEPVHGILPQGIVASNRVDQFKPQNEEGVRTGNALADGYTAVERPFGPFGVMEDSFLSRPLFQPPYEPYD